MTLSPDLERRRALSRRNKVSKSGDQVYYDTLKAVKTKENEQEPQGEIMRKALCKRLAGRQIVVGNTPFKFDSNGICELTRMASYKITAIPDFNTLLKMSGVTEVKDVQVVMTQVVKPVVIVQDDVITEEKVETIGQNEVSSKEEIDEEPDWSEAPLMDEEPKRKVGRPKKIKD